MPSSSNAALEILNLHKRFSEPAVNDLSLKVREGEFYALLGPNGAGKTTTLRMVAGLLQADAGAVRVCGINAFADPIAAKQVLAWVPDEPMVYDKLTPLEYLEFVAGLWSMQPDLARFKADSLLDAFGLAPHANERCGGFSKGMRQKVALAGALIHEPRLIILDEPLTGEHTIRVVMYADRDGDGEFDPASATPCRYEGEVVQAGPETVDFSAFPSSTTTETD